MPNMTVCRVLYRDIGDYLKKEEKLEELRKAVSVSGFSDWQDITPDKYHDWIDQRNEAFAQFLSYGIERRKVWQGR